MASGFNVAINIQTTGAPAANAALGGVGKTAATANVQVTGLTGGLKALDNALRALPIALFVRQIVEAGKELDRMKSSLNFAAGSAAAGGKELAFVRAEAQRLGLEVSSAAQSYGQFAAALVQSGQGLGLARQGFTAVSEAAAALNLSADDTRLALKALEQMVSKGKVSAEELRGQFGERIPGAFAIAARAMGKTQVELNEMMARGDLLAKDLLPRLFDELHKTFGPDAERNAHNLTQEMNRLNNEVDRFFQKSATGGATVVGVFAQIAKWINDSLIPGLRAFSAMMAGASTKLVQIITSAILSLTGLVAGLFDLIGQGLEAIGVENPMDGWLEAVDAAERKSREFLGNLSSGFFDVMQEQWALVGQEAEKIVPPIENLNPPLNTAVGLANDLADAATRARAAFTGMKPEEVLGAVDPGSLTGGRTSIEPAFMDRIEEMLDELGREVEDKAEEVRGEVANGFIKGVAHDLFYIWGGALSDVLSGAISGVRALQEAIRATAAAIGNQLAQSVGGVGGAAIGAAIPLFGAVLDAAFKEGKPTGATDFKVVAGELEAMITSVKRGGREAMERVNEAVLDVLNGILDDLGGTLQSAEFAIKTQGDEVEVFINGIRKGFTDANEAIGFLVTELFKTATVIGLSGEAANAIRLAAEQAAGDLAAFQSDLAFIQAFENFGKDDQTIALEALDRWFATASETAARLGLDLEKVNAEYAKQREEILGLAAAEAQRLAEEQRLEEERRRQHQERKDERRREREQLQADIDDAINSIAGPMEQIRDRFAEMGDTLDFLQDQVDHGRLSLERFNEALSALASQEYVNLGSAILSFVDRFYNGSLVGEQLRANLVEANRVIELANLRLQADLLIGLGLLTQAQIDLINGTLDQLDQLGLMQEFDAPPDTFTLDLDLFADGTKKATKGLKDLADATTHFADQIREFAQEQAAAAETFKSLWGQISGVGQDPAARIRAQFNELREAFRRMSASEQADFLRSQGLSPGLTNKGELFESLIGPLEAKAIADAIADALRPVVDYFNDLRRSGTGMTQTQRFRNVLDDFNAAVASKDMDEAVALARLLTGDVGVAQLGSSTAAFRNLRDQIVAALSSAFGVPAPDLGGSSYQNQQIGLSTRIATASEQQIPILRDGFRDVISRLERIERQRSEAGAFR